MKRSRVTFATIEAAAIAALVASPSTIARCSCPKSATGKPSVRQSEPGRATPSERVAQRGEVRPVQAAPVDPARAARDDATRPRCAGRAERAPRGPRRVLLGVVERAERADVAHAEALEVEQHRRGDERAGEAAAPGLVGAGDEADAEARGRTGRAAVLSLRRSRRCAPATRRGSAQRRPMRLGGQ